MVSISAVNSRRHVHTTRQRNGENDRPKAQDLNNMTLADLRKGNHKKADSWIGVYKRFFLDHFNR